MIVSLRYYLRRMCDFRDRHIRIYNIGTCALAAYFTGNTALLMFAGSPWMAVLSLVLATACWYSACLLVRRMQLLAALANPPQNVRVLMRDGEQVPAELVYMGRQPDGIHLWSTVHSYCVGDVAGIDADMIPAHTGIRLNMRAERE